MPLHLSSQTQNEADPCRLPGATERVYSNADKVRTSPMASSETHGRALFASAGFLIAVIPLLSSPSLKDSHSAGIGEGPEAPSFFLTAF